MQARTLCDAVLAVFIAFSSLGTIDVRSAFDALCAFTEVLEAALAGRSGGHAVEPLRRRLAGLGDVEVHPDGSGVAAQPGAGVFGVVLPALAVLTGGAGAVCAALRRWTDRARLRCGFGRGNRTVG